MTQTLSMDVADIRERSDEARRWAVMDLTSAQVAAALHDRAYLLDQLELASGKIAPDDDAKEDFVRIIGSLTNYIQNERVRAYNEGVDDERDRHAHQQKAEGGDVST